MKVSIILLNWNRKRDILETIEELGKQTYNGCEVIVIDQASSDDSVECIEKIYPKVKIIKLHKNVGVPAGRNIGAANATGEILIFLDNDATLSFDAVEKTVKKYLDNERIGIIGFRIVNAKTNSLDFSSWPYQKYLLNKSGDSFETYTFCGAGHSIRKSIFKKVDYYWDELFFSWEEMDLSIRTLDAGYKIIYNPEIVVYHRISEEKRTHNTIHECLRLRNGLWVLWKYFPRGYAITQSLLRVTAYLIKAIRQRCFLRMLFYFIVSFKKMGLLFERKGRISKNTLVKFKKLSDKGPIAEQIKWLLIK